MTNQSTVFENHPLTLALRKPPEPGFLGDTPPRPRYDAPGAWNMLAHGHRTTASSVARGFGVSAIMVLVAMGANSTHACAQDTIEWGAGSESWCLASNWNNLSRRDGQGNPTHNVPTVLDQVYVRNGGNVGIDDCSATCNRLIFNNLGGRLVVGIAGRIDIGTSALIDSGVAGTAQVYQEGGTFSFLASTSPLSASVGVSNRGLYTLHDGTFDARLLSLTRGGTFRVEGGTATVSTVVLAGSSRTDPSDDGRLILAGGTFMYSSQDPFAEGIRVGGAGSGEVDVSANASFIAYADLVFGAFPGGRGTLRVSDDANVRVGGLYFNQGEFQQTGGTVISGGLTIGRGDGNVGSYSISSGTFQSGALTFGSFASGDLNMTGGEVSCTTITVGDGASGSGRVSIYGGTVRCGGSLLVARAPGARGSIDLFGGSMTARDLFTLESGGQFVNGAQLTLTGADYTPNGCNGYDVHGGTFVQGPTASLRLTVGEGLCSYGVINAGQVSLAGELVIVPGFFQSPRWSRTLIRGAIVGRFDSVVLPGPEWTLEYLPDRVVVSYSCRDSCPSAAFVYVPIHGQIAEAFVPGHSVSAPPWVHEDPAYRGNLRAGQLSQSINERRDPISGLGRVWVSRVNGDWSELVIPGVQWILSGRIAYILGEPQAAEFLERVGSALASRASQQAVRRITDRVDAEIANVRANTTIPVFVDIVGASRGGAVGSAVANEIKRRAAMTGHTVAVSMTHLDAIDPSGPELHPPFALAGHLLDDPLIENGTIDRVTNYYAEFAAVNWYGDALTPTWFARHIVNGLLESWGFPHGRSRPIAGQGVDFLVSGTTHTSIADNPPPPGHWPGIFANSIGTTGPMFSTQRSTFFGTLWANPIMHIDQLLQNRCCDGYSSRAAPPSDFIVDNDFALTRGVIGRTRQALSNPVFAAELTDEIAHVRTFLTTLAQSEFPPEGPWVRSGGGVTIAATDGIALRGSDALRQELDDASLDRRLLTGRVRYVFDDAAGDFVVRLTGAGVEHQMIIVNSGTTGESREYSFITSRSGPTGLTPDLFEALGHGVRVLHVSISSCSADLDDGTGTGTPDGGVTIYDLLYYFRIFEEGLPTSDVDDGSGTGTRDGGVTIDDLIYYLFRFGNGC